MSNRRSRLSRTKATESIGPARIFRRRVVRKSSALACIRGRPGFLPARSDLIVKILVCCRQMGSYPETTFEDLWVRSTFSAARLPPCRLLDNFTSRSPKTTDAIQCPPSDNFRFARDSARTGRTQRPRTVVECICDLSQIDVLMQETHGNQTLPKVTGTGDVPDPYPSL